MKYTFNLVKLTQEIVQVVRNSKQFVFYFVSSQSYFISVALH